MICLTGLHKQMVRIRMMITCQWNFYRLRQQTVESVIGFRQFLLRGNDQLKCKKSFRKQDYILDSDTLLVKGLI